MFWQLPIHLAIFGDVLACSAVIVSVTDNSAQTEVRRHQTHARSRPIPRNAADVSVHFSDVAGGVAGKCRNFAKFVPSEL